jgi:hypothetical protein
LKAIGLTATAAGLVTVPALNAKAGSTPKRPAPKRKDDTKGTAWLAELDGARFAGCLVHDVGALQDGSVAITFSDTDGQFFVVDVLRHDPAKPGVAHAGSLGVYMRIAGEARPTREEHGLAAMALALELGRREALGLPAPRLSTLNERAAIRRSA